jgi:hypothetical protein
MQEDEEIVSTEAQSAQNIKDMIVHSVVQTGETEYRYPAMVQKPVF